MILGVADSSKPVRAVQNSEQEADVDVGCDEDCHSAELQDGW